MQRNTRTLCPTPWIPLINPVTQTKCRLRLAQYRRGGSIIVEFHKSSELAPGKSFVIRNNKTGYEPFLAAALSLLRTSHWDPLTVQSYKTCQPRWNARAVGYAARHEHATMVALYVDAILNPRRGRRKAIDRIGDARASVTAPSLSSNGYTAARENRRGEILLACQQMTNALIPILERLDARQRNTMVGYNHTELQHLQTAAVRTRAAIEQMRDMARDNRFEADYAPTVVRSTGVAPRVYEAPSGPLHIDLEEFTSEPVAPQPAPFHVDLDTLDLPPA